MINYEKLMSKNPTEFERFTNSKGQEIAFVEHPTQGDDYPVICVCHELKLASCSDFWDTWDMTQSHKEYEPSFENGKFWVGDMEGDN